MSKSRRTHDAVATIGEYTDKATGEKKKIRKNVGSLFTSPEGNLSLKLEMIPVGPGWSGFVSFYPIDSPVGQDAAPPARSAPVNRNIPSNRQSHQNGAAPPPDVPNEDDDDDLPF